MNNVLLQFCNRGGVRKRQDSLSPLSPPLPKRLRLGSDRENKEQDRKDGAVKYPPPLDKTDTSSSDDSADDEVIISRITRRDLPKKKLKFKKKLSKKEKRLKAEGKAELRSRLKGTYGPLKNTTSNAYINVYYFEK